MSQKHGLKPLSRYKAADCASRCNEFKGWSKERQIRFTKRLVGILEKYRRYGLWALGFAASLEDFSEIEPSLSGHKLRKECYKFCVQFCLTELCSVIEKHFATEKVTIFHDSGDFVADAQYVFNKFHDRNGQLATLAPLRWEKSVALQPADFFCIRGDESFLHSFYREYGHKKM